MNKNAWMLRVGDSDEPLVQVSPGFIALGFPEIGDLALLSHDTLRAQFAQSHPAASREILLRLFWQFMHDIQEGDLVVVHERSAAAFRIGEVSGPYRFDTTPGATHPHQRLVRWEHTMPFARLPRTLTESLPLLVFFRLPSDLVSALLAAAVDEREPGPAAPAPPPAMPSPPHSRSNSSGSSDSSSNTSNNNNNSSNSNSSSSNNGRRRQRLHAKKIDALQSSRRLL